MRPINKSTLPHLLARGFLQLRCRFDTALALIMAKWWGIDIGAGCRFYGLPIFRRLPNATITIGRGCDFRSAPWSNLVGLNRRCYIVTVGEEARISVGDECGISGAVISAATEISLGQRVLVGANSTIMDTDWHPLDPDARYAGKPGATAPVCIENDVWLGLNVLVLKGVRIGAGTTVAANSVVAQSLPAGVVAGGTPARVIKRLSRA
jgi:acetyltransferase-like isoleucine patch superfamily enzyme